MATMLFFVVTAGFMLIGLPDTTDAKVRKTEYAPGLMKLFTSESEDPTLICMSYPYDYYTLYADSAEKTYNLSYARVIDLCQENLTKADFTPNQPGSLILLSTSITNCSTSPYYQLIQEGGASGVVLLSNATRYLNETYGWEIFAVVSDEEITKFMNATTPGEDLKVELFGFRRFDVSLILLWLIAVFCVAVGSFTEVFTYRLISSLSPATDQDQEILGVERRKDQNEARLYEGVTIPVAIGLVIFISSTLLLLYFFYQYLVYFFIAVFCLASPRAMYLLIMQILNYFTPPHVRFPKIWKFGIHEIFFATLTLSLSMVWLVFRHENWVWGIQDILGISFCINLIQILHLPNLKVITWILVLLFIYDIFFVFITPFFTSNGKSVMVEVATGVSGSGSVEQIPVLLKFPRLLRNPADVCGGARDFSLLGYGDIIVPGFLVCFAHRFDLLLNNGGKCRVYYISSVIAYAIGLALAFVALLLSSTGQPALFYIVPSILITLFSLGLVRKEIKALWDGNPTSESPLSDTSA